MQECRRARLHDGSNCGTDEARSALARRRRDRTHNELKGHYAGFLPTLQTLQAMARLVRSACRELDIINDSFGLGHLRVRPYVGRSVAFGFVEQHFAAPGTRLVVWLLGQCHNAIF